MSVHKMAIGPSSIIEVDGALCSIQQAKATMLYNLATAFCVLKEHDKAKQALQKVNNLYCNTLSPLCQVAGSCIVHWQTPSIGIAVCLH